MLSGVEAQNDQFYKSCGVKRQSVIVSVSDSYHKQRLFLAGGMRCNFKTGRCAEYFLTFATSNLKHAISISYP